MNFKEFKRIRVKMDKTQAEFASLLGLARETVCRIERNALPVSHRVALSVKALSEKEGGNSDCDARSHDSDLTISPEEILRLSSSINPLITLAEVSAMVFEFRYSRCVYGKNKVPTKIVLSFLSDLQEKIAPHLPGELK